MTKRGKRKSHTDESALPKSNLDIERLNLLVDSLGGNIEDEIDFSSLFEHNNFQMSLIAIGLDFQIILLGR
jgi:hypothetical protein